MSFTSMASETATTTRSPDPVAGKIGPRVAFLSGLSILPLMPASKSTVQKAGLDGAKIELWETYTEKHVHTESAVEVDQIPNIEQGDVLVVNSINYEVVWVGNWGTTSSTAGFLQIMLEEVKP